MARFDSAHLDDVERVPLSGEGGITWLPIRAHFGIRSFGVNAWTADDAGAEVIGPHLETDDEAAGHEELYLVVAGRARFRVDGEEFDVAEGGFVAVTDPSAERGAVALHPATTVLTLGGSPGSPYEVAPWEFIVRALARYRAGDYAGAIKELEPALELHPKSVTVQYNVACFASLAGRNDEAVEHLRRAITLDPEVRERARRDPDFDPIRGLGEFQQLVG